MNVYQFVCVLLCLLVFRVGRWDLIVLVPDHCLSFSSLYLQVVRRQNVTRTRLLVTETEMYTIVTVRTHQNAVKKTTNFHAVKVQALKLCKLNHSDIAVT